MNENQLSKRLEKVGEFVPKNSRLADIGSDHAYLPVALVLQNKIEFAIAGEVVKGPFESAQKQVKKNGLEHQIIIRLANGLDAIERQDQIDAVTICGMGGTLITEILDSGFRKQKIDGTQLLILQPNIGEKGLRSWLQAHQYTILEEDILEENNKIYEIIVAKHETETKSYTEKELLFGPFLMKQSSKIFEKKWQREMKQRKNVLEQLKKSSGNQEEKINQLQIEIQQIKEVLAVGT